MRPGDVHARAGSPGRPAVERAGRQR
jgi:hypothetical protein